MQRDRSSRPPAERSVRPDHAGRRLRRRPHARAGARRRTPRRQHVNRHRRHACRARPLNQQCVSQGDPPKPAISGRHRPPSATPTPASRSRRRRRAIIRFSVSSPQIRLDHLRRTEGKRGLVARRVRQRQPERAVGAGDCLCQRKGRVEAVRRRDRAERLDQSTTDGRAGFRGDCARHQVRDREGRGRDRGALRRRRKKTALRGRGASRPAAERAARSCGPDRRIACTCHRQPLWPTPSCREP